MIETCANLFPDESVIAVESEQKFDRAFVLSAFEHVKDVRNVDFLHHLGAMPQNFFRCNQCDKIGRFLKVLADIFLTKVAQKLSNFLGDCKKHYFLSKTRYCCTFWGIV